MPTVIFKLLLIPRQVYLSKVKSSFLFLLQYTKLLKIPKAELGVVLVAFVVS